MKLRHAAALAVVGWPVAVRLNPLELLMSHGLRLLQICFDNSSRLSRKQYLFEYRGAKFKLVQNDPRRRPDNLLTIVPRGEPAALKRAFATAAEFLSALAWENNARVTVRLGGEINWPEDMGLEEARPSIFGLPRIPAEYVFGYHLFRIPHVRTDSQRKALAIFREANASNSDYLSFLFYWQIFEVEADDAVGFINKVYRKDRVHLRLADMDIHSLPLSGRSLGEYLSDDCRHAIAHIRRRLGKRSIELDNLDERDRLAYSVRVVKAFAQYYIREVLNLKEHLYLAIRKADCPVFADEKTRVDNRLKLMHPRIGPLISRGLTGRPRRSHGR